MSGTVISWAAATKWAVRERGDAVTVVETHRGVVCGIVVDVQGSGDGAGTLAWSLVAVASQIAGEGGSADGIATAVNRALWTRRRGRVQAGVGVVIVESPRAISFAGYGSVLLGKTNPTEVLNLGHATPPAGINRDESPVLVRHDLQNGAVVMCSDGIADSHDQLRRLLGGEAAHPVGAGQLVSQAVARDHGRPKNDMSVIVIAPAVAGVETGVATAGMLTVFDRSTSRGPENRHGSG